MPKITNKKTLIPGALGYLISRLGRMRLIAFSMAFLLMLAAGWLANLPAILLGQILDRVVESSATAFADVAPVLWFILLSVIGREVAVWIRKYIVENTATRVERDEFVGVIGHILSLDLSRLMRERVGAINVRIHRSIEGVVRLLKLLFLDFFPAIITAGIAIYLAFTRNWVMALVMVGAGIFGALVTLLQIVSQKGIRLELFSAKEGIGAKVTELLLGIDYVRASGMREYETTAAGELAESLRAKEFRHHRFMMSFDAVKQLAEGAGYVIVVALGAWYASRGLVSKGDVLTFAMLYTAVAAPLRELHRIVDEGFEAILKVRELVNLRQLPTDPGLAGSGCPKTKAPAPLIETNQLSVNYTDTLDETENRHPALVNLTVAIKRGEKIGIAGVSGSGKSTFVKVLLGLIPTYTGSVRVFGQEIKNLDKLALSKLVAYVPQRPFILHGTVRQNVEYGTALTNVPATTLWQALQSAHMETRVRALPGGLDAMIAEQGRNLSGGEQQRLVLARVFLKGAPLVILDEATAALDNQSEAFVQQAIESLGQDSTVIVIAHRLSTLQGCGRILVFDNGQVIQEGTFKGLSEREGNFRSLLLREKSLSV
ncbi:MAG: YwjA [Candidatus Magasanikbacteria bacterium GW2011_GWA2_56_11]|uniref:YwjA n=1 Tax=Candidatus Magasanikbacteria bacterium GW2011_GWA2_56_11 TaxID=1619044 RepID=A0A0G1YHR3_9BACT|nr:MAG: YwjA [Candidatus Magasanikbacteria bacterium GW2011_GWA2_56_11]